MTIYDKRLREQGLRVTQQRIKILKLLNSSKQPLSIDQIHFELNKLKSKFDLVTLYRNLNSLKEAGLIGDIITETGKIHYEFLREPFHHHHHIVCQSCNKVEHLEICGLDIHTKVIESMGYKNINHRLEFFGICKSCA